MTDGVAADSEPPAGTRSRVIIALAMAAAGFHLWSAGVSPFTALVQRPVHLLLMAAIGFLGGGVRRRALRTDWAWLLPAVFSCGWIAWQHEAVARRIGAALPIDLIGGTLAILVVLELARRVTGWPLVIIALFALAYATTGPYLPGMLAHRGYSPARIVEHLYLSAEGIWGVPLGVSADFVYLFVLFGAVLEAAGGGALLVTLAARISGRARGAPAITATVASGFMGSLSGSAVANVVTTGTLTIPLMRRAGFTARFAAAVEAAASTGGQIMPPVMGAGAFVLATWTGIPYTTVAASALLPALLYYGALLAAVHFRAVKMDLPRGDALAAEPLLPRIHLLLPIGVIVAFLAAGRSPARAAFWGVLSALAMSLLRGQTRLDAKRLRDTLVTAASSTVQVAAACATAGIIVGVASLTGIGLRLSELIIVLSHGFLPAALVLTALASLVLGMGLPTTAAYVVLAALSAPALTELGVAPLPAHLFLFYFGCISNVTPPVALAAFAAAGLAGASPMRTALTAMSLASAGFLVPFLFVYGPALLLDGTPLAILLSTATAFVGVTALAAAVIGHARRPLTTIQRIFAAAAAILLIDPGVVTDTIGLVLLIPAMWPHGGRRERGGVS